MNKADPSVGTRSQDERIMAALAHASAILPMWGAIAAIVIWATQREKSAFVAFQSLQAAVYHFVMILMAFLFGICYICSAFAVPLTMNLSFPGADTPGGEISPLFFLPIAIPFAVMALGLIAWLAFLLYGLAGAVLTLQGRDFRYALVGRRLEAYLART